MESDRKTILLIEDDQDYAVLIGAMLRKARRPGCVPVHVTSVGEGLTRLAAGGVDLVLLDLSLPDGSGLETFARVHARSPLVPIIVLSASTDDALALEAVHAGAQDYLLKGKTDSQLLVRAIGYALERKRAEVSLKESLRFAHATIDAISSHLAILDRDGTILAVNAAWREFAEENEGELARVGVGVNYLAACDRSEAGGDAVAGAASRGIREVIGGGRETFELEYPCHSRRTERWFLMRVTRFPGEGETRVVVKHENVTARRRAQEEMAARIRLESEHNRLKEAVAAMEQVLGIVGHELRTPLAALRATAEFLCIPEAREMPEWETTLVSIPHSVGRMAEIVNNLLEAARLNSGLAKWNWGYVDLAATCHEAIETVRPLVDVENVQLLCEVEPAHLRCRGDAEALRRLLVNLLSNAGRHTERGSIRIGCRPVVAEGASWVELRVTDTGTGIPPEHAAKVGEAFALNSGAIGANYTKGSGLGLAICKGITAAHGGRMAVDSKLGMGTTVTVRVRSDLAEPCQGTGQVEIARRIAV